MCVLISDIEPYDFSRKVQNQRSVHNYRHNFEKEKVAATTKFTTKYANRIFKRKLHIKYATCACSSVASNITTKQ